VGIREITRTAGPRSARLTLKVPPELKARVVRRASRERVTITALVQRLLEAALAPPGGRR
jgi:predicted HicB family RNase H-like nuclease